MNRFRWVVNKSFDWLIDQIMKILCCHLCVVESVNCFEVDSQSLLGYKV